MDPEVLAALPADIQREVYLAALRQKPSQGGRHGLNCASRPAAKRTRANSGPNRQQGAMDRFVVR